MASQMKSAGNCCSNDILYKGIVILGKWHRAAVEPAIDDFGNASHLAAALAASEMYVDVQQSRSRAGSICSMAFSISS